MIGLRREDGVGEEPEPDEEEPHAQVELLRLHPQKALISIRSSSGKEGNTQTLSQSGRSSGWQLRPDWTSWRALRKRSLSEINVHNESILTKRRRESEREGIERGGRREGEREREGGGGREGEKGRRERGGERGGD